MWRFDGVFMGDFDAKKKLNKFVAFFFKVKHPSPPPYKYLNEQFQAESNPVVNKPILQYIFVYIYIYREREIYIYIYNIDICLINIRHLPSFLPDIPGLLP